MQACSSAAGHLSLSCGITSNPGFGVNWQQRVAKLLGQIHAVESLFLESLLSDHEASLASSLAPFDVECAQLLNSPSALPGCPECKSHSW